MSENAEFYLSSASSVVELETLEISHPNFTKTYYVVRNASNGIAATIETGELKQFEFYPIGIKLSGADSDLDQTMEINFGDLGQILPQELDAVNRATGFVTKPKVIYRSYRSDNLTAILDGPNVFEVQNMPFNETGANLNVTAPKLNLSGTGETYTMNRFPMLRVL